jgi:two-component system, cell cycle sensor histidine kinase and response regulator CckA
MKTRLSVLILEDRISDAELIIHALGQAGFEPDWERVETGPDFLAKLRPELDLILSDYSMPQFDACEALRLLKESGYDIPLIIITGTISEEVAVESMRLGAADYLLKDRLGRLGPAVTRVLDDRKARLEKRQASAALRESEERYRLLVANIPDVTWTADRQARNTFISPNVEKMLGYSPEQILREGSGIWLSYGHPDDYERVKAAYEALFAAGTPFDVEYRVRTSDGQWVWLRDRAMATYEKHGIRYAYGVASDITDRKRLQDELNHSQKMEAIGRLAGGIAHDFNNLLTAIIGYSQLLISGFDSEDPRQASVQEIEKAGKSAASLTRQLLAFSRRQVLQPKVLDLNECVSNMEKMLKRLIGEDIHLETNMSPHLGRVLADPGQIEQVIINLAVNARDAMPAGGKLIIETLDVVVDEAETGELIDMLPGSYAMLVVGDDGSGMDPETLAKIFEPFFTTKELGKGTGLGLSTVYGIIEQSGGYIRVYSEPGEGTLFRIYLPRTEEIEQIPQAVPVRRPVHDASETILLVEDDDTVRSLAEQVLDLNGYSVLTASTGAQALVRSKQHSGKIDLMLTDTVMPAMSGPELAERLRAHRPDLKVVYMSGYSDEAIVQRGAFEGNMGFVQKPFTVEGLALAVRTALDSD